MNKTHTDIDAILSEFDEMPFGVTLPFNQDMMWGEKVGFEADGTEELKAWLRTTLKSQADQYEKEKEEMYAQLDIVHTSTMQEMVREIIDGVHSPIYKTRVKIIAKKYGVDLTE